MTANTPRSRLLTRLKAGVLALTRVLADLLILGLWVVFLVLVFLATGWPRAWFYLFLLAGVVLYVQLTANWFGTDDERGDDAGAE